MAELVIFICSIPIFILLAIASLSHFSKKYKASEHDLYIFLNRMLLMRCFNLDARKSLSIRKIGKILYPIKKMYDDEAYAISSRLSIGFLLIFAAIVYPMAIIRRVVDGNTENILLVISLFLLYCWLSFASWRYGHRLNGNTKKKKR